MKQVNLHNELKQIEFAKIAAKRFAGHPEISTYSLDKIEPGCFLAIRWGMGEDCVLVVKLDDSHVPINYAQLVRTIQHIT
jgi:hypothetical protein